MSAGKPDLELLKDIVAGSHLAFQVLYARHNVRLFRFLMRLTGDRALAEDLVHDVFLDVWRAPANFGGRSSLLTWIMSIAHNKGVDALRRRGTRYAEDITEHEIEDDAATPEENSIMNSDAEAIRSCLNRLSPEHKAVIDLVYYHEMPVHDVSIIAGIPENTVKTRLFHARKKLRELLHETGIEGERHERR
jgi:RNA polymerase sigma-70 factor (ECF subfamily)